MSNQYFLLEVANTHGGDIKYLYDLIESFSDYKGNYGMKFQAFHPDLISTPDFRAYSLYKTLHFNERQWKDIILSASQSKEIWLDIFDLFGVQIYKENHSLIEGIKFQSSVLYNLEVFNALKTLKLDGKKLILNIAARSIEEIKEITFNLESIFKPTEILLEFGYQAYPTQLEDSGISKIKTLNESFSNRLVFADHVEGSSEDAIWLPVVASMLGIDFIEKHVMLDTVETKYDHFSSLTPDRFEKMASEVQKYISLHNSPFINIKEEVYLEKTLMKPILKNDLPKGSIPNLERDFIFRRSNREGLEVKELKDLINSRHILANDVTQGNTLAKEDFKKARIGVVVVSRMKSTRLPKKALRKIGALTSVEYCLNNVLKLKNVDKIILATSTHPDDAILAKYTYSEKVEFYRGDPEDVMQRIVDVVKKYNLDIVSRVTADMPYVPDEIYQMGLESHFENAADYTQIIGAPIGLATSVMSSNALFKAKELFPSAQYSEYLLYYFINNPKVFKINKFEVPKLFQKPYRLTLDYEEDLHLFNIIEKNLNITDQTHSYIQKIFDFLNNNEEVASINQDLVVKYKTDQNLIDEINKYTTLKVN